MMKLIIFEGLDNTGKSTQIHKLEAVMEKMGHKRYKEIHCTGPANGMSNEEAAAFQDAQYADYINTVKMLRGTGDIDFVIFDRFMYGEYIYGPMYRGRSKEDVIQMIRENEKKLINTFGEDVSLIFFTASPEFLIKHDDGLSLSNLDPSKIIVEINDFNELYAESTIKHKRMINVADGITGEYRTKSDILADILTYSDILNF